MPTFRVNEKTAARWMGQLIDEDGAPVSKTNLSALALTLFDEDTGGIINSRNAQSILDANNGTVQADLTITAATQAFPVVITTSAAHGLRTGDKVHITSVGGMAELNDRTFKIKKLTNTTFELQGEDGTSHTAYSSGGTAYTGMVTLELQPADNAIISTTLAAGLVEEHIAELAFTHSTRSGYAEFKIEVVQLTKVT